jgi:hypothetical protein
MPISRGSTPHRLFSTRGVRLLLSAVAIATLPLTLLGQPAPQSAGPQAAAPKTAAPAAPAVETAADKVL